MNAGYCPSRSSAAPLLCGAFLIASSGTSSFAQHWKKYEKWTYNCIGTETNDFGEVIERNYCWADVCRDEAGLDCILVFTITPSRTTVFDDSELIGDSRLKTDETCGFGPMKLAVDKRPIHNLSASEQLSAVLKGKTALVEIWDRRWPYCDTTAKDFSLIGANVVYERLRDWARSTFKTAQ